MFPRPRSASTQLGVSGVPFYPPPMSCVPASHRAASAVLQPCISCSNLLRHYRLLGHLSCRQTMTTQHTCRHERLQMPGQMAEKHHTVKGRPKRRGRPLPVGSQREQATLCHSGISYSVIAPTYSVIVGMHGIFGVESMNTCRKCISSIVLLLGLILWCSSAHDALPKTIRLKRFLMMAHVESVLGVEAARQHENAGPTTRNTNTETRLCSSDACMHTCTRRASIYACIYAHTHAPLHVNLPSALASFFRCRSPSAGMLRQQAI